MQELTIEETIERIGQLIDSGKGDVGRLDHIRESLKNKKILFNSDRRYLEKMLDSYFEFKNNNTSNSELLPLIKNLIESDTGDHGRLQSIYDVLSKGKSLYQSDYNYLQIKLNESSKNNTLITSEKITSNQNEKKNLQQQEIMKINGTMPKGWTSNPSSTNKSIKNNQNSIVGTRDTEIISSEPENLELSKIKQTVQEQEMKIKSAKTDLESQIKKEREHIASQINTYEQIIEQKAELEKVKIERTIVLDKIKKEREALIKESESQKEELIQAQKDQEEIEKKIQQEQIRLEEMRKSQKSQLEKQAEFSKQLSEKKHELEKTKTEFNEIHSQIEQEKQSIEQESTLQKQNLVKLQAEKKDLENTQADYDNLL
ncbi:MAG: hypothetical protein OEM18_03695, partial [Nitrosopumilus sp.]|nr:hypothetical protein [Nitrosopumilus sp.]